MTLETLHPTKRMALRIAPVACLLSSYFQAAVVGQVRLYPEPQQMESPSTNFQLDDQALIVLPLRASKNDSFLASFLAAELADRYGVALKTEHVGTLPAGKRAILMGSINNPLVKDYCSRQHLQVTDNRPGPEGYVLEVSENFVLIAGSDEAGAFYGLQSLRQLVEKREEEHGFVVCESAIGPTNASGE